MKPCAFAVLLVIELSTSPQTRALADDGKGQPEAAETLFARAKDATGREYLRSRDQLLKLGPGSTAILRGRAAATGDEGWLAGLLLDRSRQPEEFTRLGETFADKVWRAEFGGPLVTAGLRPMRDRLYLLGRRPKPQGVGRPQAAEIARWREGMELPESPLWAAVLGEVLLKDTIADAPRPADVRVGVPDPRHPDRVAPTGDVYRRHAAHLLGQLGERRAGPALLRISGNSEEDAVLRAAAVEALGRLRYAEALGPLLTLAEDRDTPPEVQHALMPALWRLGPGEAVGRLEKLAAWPFEEGGSRRANAANSLRSGAIRALRIARGEEKAPD